MKRIIFAALIGACSFNPALAQTATAVASAAELQVPVIRPLGGPAIAGVCLLSQQGVVANAQVGKAATARLKEISDVAQSEVSTARAQLDFDAKALLSQQATLKPEDYKQQQQALAQRLQTLEQKTQLRGREIEATRQKALASIATAAQPVIAQAYTAKNCSLLFERSLVLGGNFANDLTAAVVKGLDAKITTITFEREDLSAVQQAVVRK